ncbi:glycosyltransferase family 4 protein [soil metagenome]
MSLRIAQIAPLWEQIPPPLYGGTERVVSSLTEGLVARGHDVTLFACGSSQTKAKLVSVYPRPLFRDHVPWTDVIYPTLNITAAFDRADDFDIIHMHLNKSSDYLAMPLARPIKNKVVFTLHFPYPLVQNRVSHHEFFQKYKDLNFVSISNTQREKGENLNWLGTVYNGIELAPYSFHPQPQDYFAWLGKFNPNKGVVEAIQAVKKAGARLIMAGKIDEMEKDDYKYFKEQIEPHIDGHQITYIGEADDARKNELFGHAKAFLNPIQWNEPFGLVMTEAMATGAPVISFARGAATEIVEDGKTGFLVHTVDEMVEKMKEIDKIDRKATRARVEKYFSSKTMVEGYEKIYNALAAQSS